MNRTWDRGDTGTWIEASGFVLRLLPDDHHGQRHQRFVLDVGHGQTLLITHNIEVAPRVPLGLGDRVQFRGIYEWNEQGGLVHWTHRDPMGSEDGGYVRYRKQDYV